MLPYIYLCVPSYALLSAIGLFAALSLLYFRTERFKLSFKYFIKLILFDGIFLLIFSRLLFVVTVLPDIVTNFSFELLLNYLIGGGIVFYGGLFGVVFGSYIYLKLNQKNIFANTNIFQSSFNVLPV